MNILYVTTEFVTEETKGGQATYLANIAQIFAHHGHYIFIVVLSDRNEDFEWKKNIKVCRVAYSSKVKERFFYKVQFLRRTAQFFWNYWGRSWCAHKKVKLLCRECKIDVIQYSNLRELSVIMYKKKPCIIRLSNYLTYWKHALLEKFDINNAEQDMNLSLFLQLRSFKRADYVFAPSRIVADVTGRKCKRKIEVIESPYIFENNMMDSTVYDRELKQKKYLLFFGTMNYLKGIHVIASVLDDILEKYPEMYFVFMGRNDQLICQNKEIMADEYVRRNVHKCKERVVILDPIYNKSQANYIIAKAEACVLPSRIDNLPNTCIEAMSLGKVVIGTNGASFEQLLTDGYNGFLCERDNPESLMKCIDKVMNMSEEEKEIFGKRAQERVSEMAPEKIYNQLNSVYNRVLQEAKR